MKRNDGNTRESVSNLADRYGKTRAEIGHQLHTLKKYLGNIYIFMLEGKCCQRHCQPYRILQSPQFGFESDDSLTGWTMAQLARRSTANRKE